MTAMIDMHAHWRPAEVADALRARTREPRILRNPDGAEVLKMPRMGEQKLAEAFDDVETHLARMDRQIAHRHRRKAAPLELRPGFAAVDRDKQPELGAEEEQVLLDQVLLDDVRVAAH